MQQTNKYTEKYHKPKNIRWLNNEELQRLWIALEESQDQKVANVIRLLLLTGSRRSEILQATWDQFNLERGSWTKKNTLLPLSSQAIKLLQNMKNESRSHFLFPGKVPAKSFSGIQRVWAALCERAQLPGFRIYGLRETYASHLLASGLSFSVIDNLLGSSRKLSIIPLVPLTFERLQRATEVFGDKIEKIASNTFPIKTTSH
jgi:integrase